VILASILSATLLSAPQAPVHSPRDALQLDAIGAFGFFPFDGGVGLWPRWARTVWSTRRAEGAVVLGAYAMGRYTRLTRDRWAARTYELDGLEQRYQLVATVGHVFRFLPSRRQPRGPRTQAAEHPSASDQTTALCNGDTKWTVSWARRAHKEEPELAEANALLAEVQG